MVALYLLYSFCTVFKNKNLFGTAVLLYVGITLDMVKVLNNFIPGGMRNSENLEID